MPTYAYECKSCGNEFELFQSMQDEPEKVCPECGKDVRRVIHGGLGTIFKGAGFYVNDSKKPKTSSESVAKPAACAGCDKHNH